MLYDAEGDFDRNFDWWKESGGHLVVEPQLPFENGRTDLLMGSGSRLDVQNINLLATLLVHAYWHQLGLDFQEEIEELLEGHVLKGLVEAPWVRTDNLESDDDEGFFAALQELVAYAFEESVRIKKKGRFFVPASLSTRRALDAADAVALRIVDGRAFHPIGPMIEKLSGRVAYAVMSFGGFLGWARRSTPPPGAS